ncbi:aminotransferase class IV [Geofilum sp. OHC36d9]|uniref:aminotransferase class IV n=1 Tax=Geofilum sp. OHC36d9 TaxID=3458413 RepID=UPI004033A627
MERQPTAKYLVYDGVLRTTESFFVRPSNRAFRFGDGLFETIHYHKGRLLFWNDHYQRLIEGLATLRFFMGGFPTKERLEVQILDLLVKNRVFNDGRVRITIFRRGEGLYTPDNLSASWLLETTVLKDKGYQWLDKGLHVGLFTDFPRLLTPASPFKTLASQANILAGIYAREQVLDDALVVNGNARFIESVSANLFWVKGERLFTPVVASGCVDGIMRRQIIRLAKQLNIQVMENQGATADDLMAADEIFLTNVITGIRWVVGLQQRRYFTRVARELYAALCNDVSR